MEIMDMIVFLFPGFMRRLINQRISPTGSQIKPDSYEIIGSILLDCILINLIVLFLDWLIFAGGYTTWYIKDFAELSVILRNNVFLVKYMIVAMVLAMCLEKCYKKIINPALVRIANGSSSRNNNELEYSSIWNQYFDNPKDPLDNSVCAVYLNNQLIEYGLLKGLPNANEPEKEIILEGRELVDQYFLERKIGFSDLIHMKTYISFNNNYQIRAYEGSEFFSFVNKKYPKV